MKCDRCHIDIEGNYWSKGKKILCSKCVRIVHRRMIKKGYLKIGVVVGCCA